MFFKSIFKDILARLKGGGYVICIEFICEIEHIDIFKDFLLMGVVSLDKSCEKNLWK